MPGAASSETNDHRPRGSGHTPVLQHRLTRPPCPVSPSVGVIVTSPPYNLGVRYRSYHDALSGEQYLQWTREWIAGAARVLTDEGSLFLNVGSKPVRPWTAYDVAAEARQHLELQNTIHWIKSIVIDRELAGTQAGLQRDLAVGHYKPVNSERFVNDCHEYVFHFTPTGRTPLDRRAVGVEYQEPVQHRSVAVGLDRAAVPRQHMVHPVLDNPESSARPSPPRYVSTAPTAAVSPAARDRTMRACGRPVYGARELCRRVRGAGP